MSTPDQGTAERVDAAPVRIQLSRAKGWTKPPGTIVVSRPTKWGNPWRVSDGYSREQCAERFETYLRTRRHPHPGWMDLVGYPSDEEIRAELAGKNLACWCAPGKACHADELLGAANTPIASAAAQEVTR